MYSLSSGSSCPPSQRLGPGRHGSGPESVHQVLSLSQLHRTAMCGSLHHPGCTTKGEGREWGGGTRFFPSLSSTEGDPIVMGGRGGGGISHFCGEEAGISHFCGEEREMPLCCLFTFLCNVYVASFSIIAALYKR